MKSAFILFFSLLVAVSTYGQNFEGRILYTNSYKSKMANVVDQQWSDMMGVTQEYFMKGGDYKSIMNGKMVQWQLYRSQDNKLYTKMANSEAALWNDAGVNPDEVLKAEVKKGAATVLNYKCDELTLTCKSGIQKYYFSSTLGIDARLFANHKYGNWSEVVKHSRAVPLKMVIESPQMTLVAIATEVKPQKLDAKMFELPAGLKAEKSPY
ncbi:hypothetical protein GCM10023185_45100 [Hymenobacter saemangeumensis]|uniref:DUF4412 domain-containing protein n=1 Tax=Hymenobacter saemangeumensis TaxID=1084522 RepID=A0ABP8ITM8_9BACT